jgi:hypothetical protein
LKSGPSLVFGPVVAHLPSPQRRPTCELAQWPSASPHGLPFFSLADMRTPPSSPSVGEAGRATPSSSYRHASLVHHPSPTPWREANPPRPLPLPLLYWLPSPPPLPVTDVHRLHFTVARSPPSPSAPIKGAPAVPHLTSPHPTPRSFPPLLCWSSPPPRAFNRHHFATITRPLHRRSISGEGSPDTATSPSPSSAPCGDRR